MSKETDLLKIQIYADYCHSTYTVQASYFYGAVVTIGVSMIILLLQNIISIFIYVGSLIATGIVLGGYLRGNSRDYHKNLYKNDSLIAMVDSGKALPSIEEIIKK